jgi:hypothetical protein
MINFAWNGGFAAIQKKKNIAAMHAEARAQNLFPLLEVSTKSDEKLGVRLSAFNLKIHSALGDISIESAYQGSKVFRNGGPYKDIYEMDSRSAKTDPRLKDSGPLIGFNYFGDMWPLEPKTAFFDWLYLSALKPHQVFLERLFDYQGFTDIEFNPEKSLSCQARTCALLVSFLKNKTLDQALASKMSFLRAVSKTSVEAKAVEHRQQRAMF